jgi:four helix bundle protein
MDSKRVESFRDLVVWQKSHEFVLEIYKITPKFPRRDKNMLAQQLREAAIQIPFNIEVGFKRRGRNAKVHYYHNSLSAIEQATYLLKVAQDLQYCRGVGVQLEAIDAIEKMLKRLIRSVSPS